MRSRLQILQTPLQLAGIISACAEQTSAGTDSVTLHGDHLRVCGADNGGSWHVGSITGSSPRVRSRLQRHRGRGQRVGIISACAEQTLTYSAPYSNAEDHLRVCGADAWTATWQADSLGSSPRVRSRRRPPAARRTGVGIISACAEQTPSCACSSTASRDHLRVCGADPGHFPGNEESVGSSPRVRSRRRDIARNNSRVGIISACAEQTGCFIPGCRAVWDHLRVCGADSADCARQVEQAGSSPRVRSRLEAMRDTAAEHGIISACAEQT